MTEPAPIADLIFELLETLELLAIAAPVRSGVIVGGRAIGCLVDDPVTLQCVASTSSKARCKRSVFDSVRMDMPARKPSVPLDLDALAIRGHPDFAARMRDELIRGFLRQRCPQHLLTDGPDAVPLELVDLGAVA